MRASRRYARPRFSEARGSGLDGVTSTRWSALGPSSSGAHAARWRQRALVMGPISGAETQRHLRMRAMRLRQQPLHLPAAGLRHPCAAPASRVCLPTLTPDYELNGPGTLFDALRASRAAGIGQPDGLPLTISPPRSSPRREQAEHRERRRALPERNCDPADRAPGRFERTSTIVQPAAARR